MEPKHLAPITRTTSVNDPSEIPNRLALLPWPTFTVLLPDGRSQQGFRDGDGAGWVITGGARLPRPLQSIAVPYLISYPIAPEISTEDAVIVRGAVLSTERERDIYGEHFADADGETSAGQQAVAVDGTGKEWRLVIDWETGQVAAGAIFNEPGGGGGGSGGYLSGLPLPITVIEID